jgi:hypothetical protein
MAQLPMDQITAASKGFVRYHFRLEHVPGILYEGDLDLGEGRQHYHIGPTPDGVPSAEVFWEGREGYGRHEGSSKWVRLRGAPLPNLQHQALDLLQPGTIASVREQEASWVAEVKPDRFPPRDDSENWVRRVFGGPHDDRSRAVLEHIAGLARALDLQTTLVISRRSYCIDQVDVQNRSHDVPFHFRLTFTALVGDVTRLPAGAREAAEPGLTVPPELLLLRISTIGGWDTQQHCSWAQRSLQSIKDEDLARADKSDVKLYEEIYHPDFGQSEYLPTPPYPPFNNDLTNQPWHPVVLGANYEDCTGCPSPGSPAGSGPTRALPPFYDDWFENSAPQFVQYFNQPPYSRYFHHFGGDGEGLEYHTWMFPAEPPQYTCKNSAGKDSYYSARDWGYGPPRIDEKWNLMTFKQAIKQYHLYTFDGKRTAYLMFGHVVHLLQDQSEPDHANLVAHAASGMNEEEAYDKFRYCEISAANSAAAAAAACGWPWGLLCGAAAYSIHFGICRGTMLTAEGS